MIAIQNTPPGNPLNFGDYRGNVDPTSGRHCHGYASCRLEKAMISPYGEIENRVVLFFNTAKKVYSHKEGIC